MLNRIVIINSDLYGKADILIGDSTSIQLEAESNVGKSSLINTLNFLYIPDKLSMKFEGGRSLKESIKHYFKTVSQSFIVFEINKGGYTYCIFVKATANSEIEYYKFDSSYHEEYFFEKSEKGFSPYKFEKVLENILLETNTNPQSLSPEDLYKIVYSDKKEKKPVVLTTDKITRTGKSLSNNFSRIYRYLLKSSEIDEDEFKKALLIADNKQDEKLHVFADRSKRQIYELRQTKNEIDILRSIIKDFEILTRLNDDYNSLKNYCGKLKFTFVQLFNKEMKFIVEQLEESSDLSREIRILTTNIDVTLRTQYTKHKQNVTKCETQLEFENTALIAVNAELETIKQHDVGTLAYGGLVEKLNKLKSENAELLNELNAIQNKKINEVQLNLSIKKVLQEEQQLKNKINDYDKLLGQNISDNLETKIRINNILSRKVLDLKADKNILIRKAKEYSDLLKVFDGEINLSEVEISEIETIEEVRSQLEEKRIDLRRLQVSLIVAADYDKKHLEYDNREVNIKELQTIYDKVQNKDIYSKRKEAVLKKIDEFESEKLKENDASFKVEQEIGKQQIFLTAATTKKRNYELRKGELLANKKRVASLDVEEVEEIVNKNIDEAFAELENKFGEFFHKKLSRHEQYLTVNKDLKSDIKEIDKFIEYIEKRIGSIGDLEYTAQELLQTVSIQFTKPTADFIALFYDFQKFIRDYNKELDKFPVSNITGLSLQAIPNKQVESLQKIANIESIGDLFFQTPEQEENLKALEEKFKEGKEIAFDDLFDLKLILEIDGEKKPPVDLNKQVESKATNRVLKLFLFLSIIRRLVENSTDNKVVLYIDELGEIGPHNVRQIINYCSLYNFIPIFAAPRQIEGIEKYYVIKKSSKKQPLIVDEWNVKRTKYKNAK